MRTPARALLHLCAAGCLVNGMAGSVPERPSSPVLSTMQAELTREMNALGKEPAPPYFLSYEITDTQFVGATASFGQLVWSSYQMGNGENGKPGFSESPEWALTSDFVPNKAVKLLKIGVRSQNRTEQSQSRTFWWIQIRNKDSTWRGLLRRPSPTLYNPDSV